MILLGINGFKTSGKDTLAGFIAEDVATAGYVADKVAFAYRLKVYAARALGFDRPDDKLVALMDSMKDESNISVFYDEPDVIPSVFDTSTLHSITGREYLQHVGNEARKVFGDTFWIDQVLPNVQPFTHDESRAAQLKAMYPGADVLLVTDVRYPNEAQRIKLLGGWVVEVIRPGLESDGHASETPLPRELVDWQVNNDGSLNDLKAEGEMLLDDAWIALR